MPALGVLLALAGVALPYEAGNGASSPERRAASTRRSSTHASSAALTDQFVEVSKQAGIQFTLTSGGPEKRYIIETKGGGGIAWIDYDNDGDLEIMVPNMNASVDLLRHARKNRNHSILVKTIGTRSNRDGIGAEVKVVSGNLTQYDTVRSGGGYLSSSDLRLHFGLGGRTAIERMEVRWPSSRIDLIKRPPVDRILTVKEGQGLINTKPFDRSGKSRK